MFDCSDEHATIQTHVAVHLLKPNSITLSGSNQFRTSSEPASVMEFGFYHGRCSDEPGQPVDSRFSAFTGSTFEDKGRRLL